MKLVRATLILLCLYSNACSLLIGVDDDAGKKNEAIKFEDPGKPFEHVSVSAADHVWQSKKTGNTIAVNSLCKKSEDLSLDALKDNLLSGIENLKVTKTEMIDFDERKAQRITATGTTEDVPITVNLVIHKKNGCTYDLTYIAKTSHYEKEKGIFDLFVKGFHAP